MDSSPITSPDLPVVIIGAGPIGLAAHLARRDEPFLMLEAGSSTAASVREWAHVTLFTPWRYDVDTEARTLLEETGWTMPDPLAYPTGAELVHAYLDPLAQHPAIAPHVRVQHRVTAIAHEAISKTERGREEDPFLVYVTTPAGDDVIVARAVIDASGAWSNPNPIGANGLPVPGERALQAHIQYRVPDVAGADRNRYLGKRVLVVGSGHSALNALQDLVTLATEDSATQPIWALRRETSTRALAACADDPLTERTLVKKDVREMLEQGGISAYGNVRISQLSETPDGIVAWSGNYPLPPVDEVIVATGFRPDLSIERELQLDLHPVFESARGLAPIIDPDANACGTVPPHGVRELAHPEPDFFVVGMKSYGRAPTFLLLTGYEQVRSVVASLVGDASALEVQLDLPEKGLCSACTAFLEDREAGVACGCGSDDADPDDACCVPTSDATETTAMAAV